MDLPLFVTRNETFRILQSGAIDQQCSIQSSAYDVIYFTTAMMECERKCEHLFGENTQQIPPHLGSEMAAECITRPQYVLRSY